MTTEPTTVSKQFVSPDIGLLNKTVRKRCGTKTDQMSGSDKRERESPV